MDQGTAVLHLKNLCTVFDAFTVCNSLGDGVPAHAMGFVGATINSLRLEWHGISQRFLSFKSTDPVNQFAGDFFKSSSASLEVTATTPATKPPFTPTAQDGFRFVGNPATVVVNFAQIGHEHKGVFFADGSEEDKE